MNLLKQYDKIMIPSSWLDVPNLKAGSLTFTVRLDYDTLFQMRKGFPAKNSKRSKYTSHITDGAYLADLDRARDDMCRLRHRRMLFKKLATEAPRKKDGTFINGKVLFSIPYDNTTRVGPGYWFGSVPHRYVLRAVTFHDRFIYVSITEERVR